MQNEYTPGAGGAPARLVGFRQDYLIAPRGLTRDDPALRRLNRDCRLLAWELLALTKHYDQTVTVRDAVSGKVTGTVVVPAGSIFVSDADLALLLGTNVRRAKYLKSALAKAGYLKPDRSRRGRGLARQLLRIARYDAYRDGHLGLRPIAEPATAAVAASCGDAAPSDCPVEPGFVLMESISRPIAAGASCTGSGTSEDDAVGLRPVDPETSSPVDQYRKSRTNNGSPAAAPQAVPSTWKETERNAGELTSLSLGQSGKESLPLVGRQEGDSVLAFGSHGRTEDVPPCPLPIPDPVPAPASAGPADLDRQATRDGVDDVRAILDYRSIDYAPKWLKRFHSLLAAGITRAEWCAALWAYREGVGLTVAEIQWKGQGLNRLLAPKTVEQVLEELREEDEIHELLPDFWRPDAEAGIARNVRWCEIAEWLYNNDPAFGEAYDRIETEDEATWQHYLERAKREVEQGLRPREEGEEDWTDEDLVEAVREELADREGWDFTAMKDFAQQWAGKLAMAA